MANRLESLELQGFKTFSTITRLEFPGQITAIVGPNGSGKSNIADSIRWVLGEQSYSLLRAKRTEDMIFSGSQQRPRAGMASTTITFNNEGGWLPIDYSEVTVSRRAYRDGQNEYLLNGQKVRLKDITELLSQTGLAEMSYTIIGQGLVDVALALKPDERRKLFEEAAGIGLYRSRREESLRRLEATRKNLDRVLDIMTEIKPRLRSLERQATRFNEYERLRADLQVLLREWYGYHWHQKQQDLRNVRNAYLDQEKRLGVLRHKQAEVGEKVEGSRKALQSNRKSFEAAHNELATYHRELEQSTRELAIIDERRRSYNQQKSNLEIDIANVQEAIKELGSQEVSFKEEIDQRLADFNAATDEVKRVEEKLSNVSGKKEAAEAQLNAARKKRVTLETENVQVSAHLDELRNRLETYLHEQSRIEASLHELDQQKESLSKKMESFDASFTKIKELSSKVEFDLQEKDEQIERLRDEKQRLSDKVSSLETAQVKLQAQLDILQQAEAALSGYSEGSKTVLEDSRKGRLPKGIEPLSQHIIIDEKYERALSAALGELADLLIIPSDNKDIVVKYLESQDRDRVALLPLDHSAKKAQLKRLAKRDGVIGYANELVQADEKYRNLVDDLLSDILIVDNTATAQSLQPELQGLQKAVTLKGIVYQANGILISGQNAAGKRIGRTRRKNEMQQELADLEEKVTKQKTELVEIDSSMLKCQEEHHTLAKNLRNIERERESAWQQLQNTRDELTRLNEQVAWHNERLSEIKTNQEKTRKHVQDDEMRLENIHSRVAELLEEEKLLLADVNAFPVFEVQQELNNWHTHRIITQNALETSRQRYQDHHNRIIEAWQRLETYQSRFDSLEAGLVEIQQQDKILKEAVSKTNQLINDVERNQIDPLTAAEEEAEKSASALQKLEEHSLKQMIIAERQYTQLQLELSRRNDQLQNLQQHIEDDFGLVSYDYEQRVDGPKPLPFDDGTIEDLPFIQEIPDILEDNIKQLKTQIRRIGAINPEAQQEYIEVKDRHEFLTNQVEDLESASKDLREVINELDLLMERDFIKTFKAVNQEFSSYFTRLFNGGEAKLLFSDDEDPVEGGIDIEARLPGQRSQGLALLSGGERSLTAVALIFALLKVSPTPFCILDEVDAMLDESNVSRFIDLLQELAKKTQFVIITHNRNTVQAADVIYGVTMGRDSTSQMISLKLEDVDETYLE